MKTFKLFGFRVTLDRGPETKEVINSETAIELDSDEANRVLRIVYNERNLGRGGQWVDASTLIQILKRFRVLYQSPSNPSVRAGLHATRAYLESDRRVDSYGDREYKLRKV